MKVVEIRDCDFCGAREEYASGRFTVEGDATHIAGAPLIDDNPLTTYDGCNRCAVRGARALGASPTGTPSATASRRLMPLAKPHDRRVIGDHHGRIVRRPTVSIEAIGRRERRQIHRRDRVGHKRSDVSSHSRRLGGTRTLAPCARAA